MRQMIAPTSAGVSASATQRACMSNAADGFHREGDIGEPARQADGFEIVRRSGKAEGQEFERDAMGRGT